MPWKPTIHRPAGAKISAEVRAEVGPAASERGPAGLRRPMALGSVPVSGGAPLVRRSLVEGCRIPATVVDHVEPHRGDERLFWDQEDQWQVL